MLLFVESQLRFTCIIHRTVLRSCALSAETALKTLREKWKVPPLSLHLLLFVIKDFFLHRERNEEQAGRWVDKVYGVASRCIFAQLSQRYFVWLNFNGIFIKPSVGPRTSRWFASGKESAKDGAGAAKWKGNFAIRVMKTHGMSYLFLLSASVAILFKNRKNLPNYDQFYKVCVSL